MKSIKKLFTMGLAVMMALSIPFSVSAAELEDASIDESRTGSLTIYKYGLTNAEKAEQQTLRQEYLADVKASLRAQLNNTSVKEPDGTVHKLGKKN